MRRAGLRSAAAGSQQPSLHAFGVVASPPKAVAAAAAGAPEAAPGPAAGEPLAQGASLGADSAKRKGGANQRSANGSVARAKKKGTAVAATAAAAKAEEAAAESAAVEDAVSAGRAKVPAGVNKGRVRILKPGHPGDGPVVYWVSRDQRAVDNWALLYAAEQPLISATDIRDRFDAMSCQAKARGVALAVVFNLVASFLNAQARHFGFMLRGLREMQAALADMGIPFFLFQGKAEETVPAFLQRSGGSLLVMDFSPLRIGRQWRDGICASVPDHVAVHEVDAHNVVPCWVASDKLEYAARTIRTKIHRHLNEYLCEYCPMPKLEHPWSSTAPDPIDWDNLIEEVTKVGAAVPEVDWIKPGAQAASEGLKTFLRTRMAKYDQDRNDPGKPLGTSGLSAWLHYGHIAAQRCALEAKAVRKQFPKPADSFLEELVVRRELADNYCYYQPEYDNLGGAWEWAQATLAKHAQDKREFLYTREQLEQAKTYDDLWNAAQLEMVHYGKMHGFMRMYWAKKILEWTASPEEAIASAIYLNDKYEVDGRDPNGYVGCMWSIAGVHDQVWNSVTSSHCPLPVPLHSILHMQYELDGRDPNGYTGCMWSLAAIHDRGWGERPVFGKIRYMNRNGCARKFNVGGYIMYVNKMMTDLKRKRGVQGKIQGDGAANPDTAVGSKLASKAK
eukprot:SM000124S25947  [mRNA]  locus=s124:236395:240712:- [translate_table: standard]